MTSTRLTRVLRALSIVTGLILAMSLAAAFYLFRLSETLPDLTVDPASLPAPRTSIVYAADGSVLAEWHGEQDRTVIPYDAIPADLLDAVIAIEDDRFYEHTGVDMAAALRAFGPASDAKGPSSGGSTITQQLVKLLFSQGERTWTRKVREALLAWELENRTDKPKVLEAYLNLVYFGHGAYGAQAAARTFFGVEASDLSLAQCATLAGMIRSPGRYSPRDKPEAALERRDLVLARMREQGMISPAEEKAARAERLVVAAERGTGAVRAPYFVEYVKAQLMEVLGAEEVYAGGLRVQTTLEPALQAAAERAAASSLPRADDPEVALVSLRHRTGDIVAMVGGRDFGKDKYNLATQGRRQPGSAFKPFVLVAALESGVKPDDVFLASPYTVRVADGTWNVQNYENQFTSGSMSLRAATNWSVNAVYARLIMQVGPGKVVDVARRMGIRSTVEPNPAIALGGLSGGVSPLEMCSAYGTIATGGTAVEPGAIVRVSGPGGEVVYEPARTRAAALSKPVAQQAAAMLHDVVERGTGVEARTTAWAAGKTGTTQSYRDAWFVGYAGDFSTAVWVGYRRGQVAMKNVHGIQVTGGSFPARIWKAYMGSALAHRPAPQMSEPASGEGTGPAVAVARLCVTTRLVANERCPDVVEMEIEPTLVPSIVCGEH